MIILADLLFVGAPGIERDAERGWQLCATALELGFDQHMLCSRIEHSVRSIVMNHGGYLRMLFWQYNHVSCV